MTPELARALASGDGVALGGRIRAARLAAGLTQSDAAGPDASVPYLSRIESGKRRPSSELLQALSARLGVTVDYLVLGEDWEEARRLELLMDHAELSLVGGDGSNALAQIREVLESPVLGSVHGGQVKALYIEAAALDALGDPRAEAAFERLLAQNPDSATKLKAATSLSRILREQGRLELAISRAQLALQESPPEVLATEEGVRLQVTLAAALFTDGRSDEAAEICDRAILESERLSSPVARASAYWNASVIRSESGHVAEAITMARRALHLLENTERVRDLGRLRVQLGAIMLRTEPPRLEDAEQQLRLAGTELDWSEASPADRARHHLVSAQARMMSGDASEAQRSAHAVLDTATEDLALIKVGALSMLAQIAWSTGDREETRSWFTRAIALLTGIGADREAAQLWFELGTLAAEAGLAAEAADAFRRAAASTGLRSRLPVIPQTATADSTAGTTESTHVG